MKTLLAAVVTLLCAAGSAAAGPLYAVGPSDGASIDALELNPQVVDLVVEEYAQFAGSVYSNSQVALHIVEAREYLSTTEKLPLSVGLANFQEAYGGTPWHLMMAASLIAVAPLIVIFFALNRYFVQGVVISGVKG